MPDAALGGVPEAAEAAWRGADVLVLSPTPTHPQDHGNRRRIFRVCQRLKVRGARITFVHYPAEAEWRLRIPPAAAAMAATWDAYYSVPVTRPLHPAAAAHDHTIDEWWDEAIGEFLRWLFRVAQFDVFIVNYSWLSKAFAAAPERVFKILDTHDLLAGRRQLLALQGIAAEYFHTTDEEEAVAIRRADLVWAIKDEERAHFEQFAEGPVLGLPHLDPVRPLPIAAPDPEGYLRVGVIGARNNLNLMNLQDFLAAAIPIFERFFAPVIICVAGGMCDDLYGVDERFVRLHGRVDEVEDFYRDIDLVCIAMRASTGLKTKTGEALALGLPVVSLAHGFEGYVAQHPLHRLASWEELAQHLVDIAFEPELLAELRAASLAAAAATESAIDATIEASWQVAAPRLRAVVFCVSAVVFDEKAAERSAFVSALEYLDSMANVTVLVVDGPLDHLCRGGRGPDSNARLVVARALVDGDERAASLAAHGFAIAAIEDVVAGPGQRLVVVDALSPQLLDIAAVSATVVLRAELVAQGAALEPRREAIVAFLQKFARAVVLAPRSAPILGALAAGAGAELVAAPCCWRSAATRRQFRDRRRARQVLLLSDGQMRGRHLLERLVRELGLEPVGLRPPGCDRRGPAAAGTAAAPSSGHDYLSRLVAGSAALPEFAVDLSFGAPGLQYLRELLLRLEVPMIEAAATAVTPPAAVLDDAEVVHTYEALVARIVAAAQGALGGEAERRRIEIELEGDSGWAWLWRYGFDAPDFGVGSGTLAAAEG
jgi:hypothetical protein